MYGFSFLRNLRGSYYYNRQKGPQEATEAHVLALFAQRKHSHFLTAQEMEEEYRRLEASVEEPDEAALHLNTRCVFL